MTNPVFIQNPPKAYDLRFFFGTFAETSAKVEAISENGKEFLASIFGAGAVGCELPKTKASDLVIFAEQRGLCVAIRSDGF